MTGRHRNAGDGRTRGSVWSFLGALLVVALVATLTVRWLMDADLDCGDHVPLTVDAAPSIAPALTEFVQEKLPQVDGEAQCLAPTVVAVDPKTVADALTAAEPEHSPGQVWIPDSTVWLQRANAAGASVPERGRSVASSPVVLATSEHAAAAGGWPDKQATWSQVLAGSDNPGIPDPATNAGALFALIGIDNLDWSATQKTKTISAMSKITIPSTDNPYHQLPEGGSAPTVSSFPSSEQQVLRHNNGIARGNPGSVVAAYPDTPTPWLDYPAVVRADLDQEQRAAGEALRKVLRSEAAHKVFAKYGFRDADGKLTGTAADDERVLAAAGPLGPTPDARRNDVALKQWATLSRVARVLVVVDVSGSMHAPVANTGQTRMQVTVQAASEGLRLFRPTTQLALWEFSTRLDGKIDHREVVGYKPMIQHIADDLPKKLGELLSFPEGGTGLYDTVLAGYKETMRAWDPAHLNLLVVLTDGKNEDSDGISRSRLLADLGTLTDPDRPAQIVFIGMGTDVDPKELRD
ncbi:MAG: substrate-binding and VWA domain-containing protein, partial [Haloechinothrix sp.]